MVTGGAGDGTTGQIMRTSDGAAFVTGGSSGIGLAVAVQLAQADRAVVLFAQDVTRLEAAASQIRSRAKGADVRVFALDVADYVAVAAAVEAAVTEVGAPGLVVLAAGMTLPGRCVDLPIAAQRRVMDVNYFGCLNMVMAVAPMMRPGGAIGLVGSAAGLVGTYGYGAYAPSKFALRGLAEVLRVELAPRGIGVTLCLPPDTDTPMLAAERGVRPAVTERMAGKAGVCSAEAVAGALIAGMEAGRFLVLPGITVKLLYLFGPWIAPFLRAQQRRLIRELGE